MLMAKAETLRADGKRGQRRLSSWGCAKACCFDGGVKARVKRSRRWSSPRTRASKPHRWAGRSASQHLMAFASLDSALMMRCCSWRCFDDRP